MPQPEPWQATEMGDLGIVATLLGLVPGHLDESSKWAIHAGNYANVLGEGFKCAQTSLMLALLPVKAVGECRAYGGVNRSCHKSVL